LNKEEKEFTLDADKLSNLFDQDKIHDLQEGTDVSQSLYELQNDYEGVKGVIASLRSDVNNGIHAESDLDERKKHFGENKDKPRKIKTLWELILENFEDCILKILVVAAIFNTIIGIWKDGWTHGWIDGASIFIAIIIIVSVTAGNNYVKEKQFQELQSKQDVANVVVVRDGQILTLDSKELVVGDICLIAAQGKESQTIAADCILVSGTDLTCDEAQLTGEPEPMRKDAVTDENYNSNISPFVLKGSLINTGEAKVVVAAVGKYTRAGRAERIMDLEGGLTPL